MRRHTVCNFSYPHNHTSFRNKFVKNFGAIRFLEKNFGDIFSHLAPVNVESGDDIDILRPTASDPFVQKPVKSCYWCNNESL